MSWLLVACGGSRTSAETLPATELTQEHRRVFEHGVDYLDDPAALGGRWEMEWEQNLASRVRRSHFIGIVRIEAMHAEQQPDRPATYRLHAEVERRLLGHASSGGLSLISRPEHAGFPTLDDKHDRILDQRFVAFVVWSRDEGERRAHWHLAPAADPVIQRVRAVIEEERPGEAVPGEGPRVIRHRNP